MLARSARVAVARTLHDLTRRGNRRRQTFFRDEASRTCGEASGTDANSIQVSRSGVATGLVSIPNRYMHSPVEVVSLVDLDRSADLLARFSESLGPDDDFTP